MLRTSKANVLFSIQRLCLKSIQFSEILSESLSSESIHRVSESSGFIPAFWCSYWAAVRLAHWHRQSPATAQYSESSNRLQYCCDVSDRSILRSSYKERINMREWSLRSRYNERINLNMREWSLRWMNQYQGVIFKHYHMLVGDSVPWKVQAGELQGRHHRHSRRWAFREVGLACCTRHLKLLGNLPLWSETRAEKATAST